MSDLDKPTEEQIKEFWEWCGLRYEIDEDEYKVTLPDGDWYNFGHDADITPNWQGIEPELDLNNLFKYAVPFLWSIKLQSEVLKLLKRWIEDIVLAGKDPALPLFWALWQALKKEVKDG